MVLGSRMVGGGGIKTTLAQHMKSVIAITINATPPLQMGSTITKSASSLRDIKRHAAGKAITTTALSLSPNSAPRLFHPTQNKSDTHFCAVRIRRALIATAGAREPTVNATSGETYP